MIVTVYYKYNWKEDGFLKRFMRYPLRAQSHIVR